MTNNSAPRYHPREIKTYVHIKTYMQMFMTILFIINKNWK